MAARIALRNMRKGSRKLWLLVAGVFIGASAIALVGTTSQALIDGARLGALESIGGDLSLRLFHRGPGEDELNVIRQEGKVSITTEARPMARTKDGASLLVELKGVDENYPLYGTVEILPAFDLYKTLEQRDGVYGAVADQALFDTLGLKSGDHIGIGDGRYQLRGVLVAEPDRVFRAFTLGPRLMVLRASLQATGVTRDGAEVYSYTRVQINPEATKTPDVIEALARIDRAFPEAGWRMVNAHDGVPGVERTLAIGHTLLLFIGMGVLLIGGAGISGAVRAHVAEKMQIIAILKSIGAPPRVVSLAIWIEIMAAASIGIALGVGLGAFGPFLVSTVIGPLPFSLEPYPSLKPLFVTALFGFLVTMLFAWGPLLGVQNIKARVLLRARTADQSEKLPSRGWRGTVMISLALVLLVIWESHQPALSVGFLIGALVLAAFYYGLGRLMMRLARTLAKGSGAQFRVGLSNLYRMGAPTGPVVIALGLTLTLLVALDGISSTVSQHLQKTLPHSAPDLVGFSIKPELVGPLTNELATSGLVEHQRTMPFLHARVQAIDGKAVRDLEIPRPMNWVIRGDRGVSFAVDFLDGSGWAPTQSESIGFSVEASVAKKLGLRVGQSLTMNVSGYLRTGPVFKFHDVDWTGLDLDFPIIATPITFSSIPHTYAASLKAKLGKSVALENFVKKRFPNVPLVRVGDVVASLAKALDAVLVGLRSALMMCGLAALVVLAGSVLQGLRERTDETVLFKVLGAGRRQLLGQLAFEFVVLGTLVALAAVPIGLSIAYGVALAAGLGSVAVLWMNGLGLAATAIVVTLIVGLTATLSAFTASPANALRSRAP